MAARTAPGDQVGGPLAGGEGEVAVGGLVNHPVDGSDPAADVDQVALGDARQALRDERRGGYLAGLGGLLDDSALPRSFGSQEGLRVRTAPHRAAVAADAEPAHLRVLAAEL
jgi:hypothetical protein